MKYMEFVSDLQTFMRSRGWIKGYVREQEIRAEMPCHEALSRLAGYGAFSMVKSAGAGRFYDIYVSVEGQKICVGYFGNDGTIRRQPVSVCFFKVGEYGAHDLNIALLEMARDYLQKKRDDSLRVIACIKSELDLARETLEETINSLQDIEKDIRVG